MVPFVSECLMNMSACDVYLSSRCDLGDLLLLFFKMDRLTSVSPTVCSCISTSCHTHNPNSDYCVHLQWSCFLNSGPFWTSCLAFHCLKIVTHTCPHICNLHPFCAWHIRADANNRMTVSCSCFQIAIPRKLIWFTWRTGASRDFSFWCTVSILSVFALWSWFRWTRTWSITFAFTFAFAWLTFGTLSFHQPMSTILGRILASVTNFPSDGICIRCHVASHIYISIFRHLIQVLVDQILQACAICSFILLYCILMTHGKKKFLNFSCVESLKFSLYKLSSMSSLGIFVCYFV